MRQEMPDGGISDLIIFIEILKHYVCEMEKLLKNLFTDCGTQKRCR